MTLLAVRDLRKLFPVETQGTQRSLFRRGCASCLHAVDDVSFTLDEGEALGLVGESGCGKSTLASLIVRLADPTSGSIRFDGIEIGETPAAKSSAALWRSSVQMVFQDAYESLDPRRSIRHAVAAPLMRLEGLRGRALDERVEWARSQVHLGAELMDRLPHQLSGGQLARAGIGRAIALRPRLLVLDEPTSALDVSVQAVILQLLDRLRRELGLAMIFVSHDLNVVRLLCQRVLVMYAGRIVEDGLAEDVFDAPLHPYTAGLVAAIPAINPAAKARVPHIPGEPVSPINPPPHRCRFESRCFRRQAICGEREPLLVSGDHGRAVACHDPVRSGPGQPQ
jgi:oligopeptide/dipeptide ABC transporter ATP-binding protein